MSKMRFEPIGQKMFTRRNWLLRCSILINIAVILYIASHAMIRSSNSFPSGSAFIFQEQQQQQQTQPQLPAMPEVMRISGNEQIAIREPLSKNEQALPLDPQPPPSPDEGGGGAGGSTDVLGGPLSVISGSSQAQRKEVTLDVGAASVPEMEQQQQQQQLTVIGDDKDYEERLRSLIKCYDRPYNAETLQRGDFWVLQNYIRATHDELKCHETITYTTHADYTFLDNLIPLLERWNAPVSIAMHAPGTDFQPTLESIKYLRDCLPGSNLVRMFATFHIYFGTKHIPKNVPKHTEALRMGYNCTLPPPYFNITSGHLYKTQKKLLYPVNVGRNIARDAAMTHFILPSDIELYPNPGLVKKFLEMIARNDEYLQRKAPRVFPLSIFEVEQNSNVPRDKTELQELLRGGKAIPFHKHVCPNCHGVPKSKEWMAANETDELSVFHIGKRTGYFVHWEPIYIGTHADPHYDERLSWEGKSDKMPQGYALCVLDYEFHILDNAFLVHKPGIKKLKKDNRRAMLAGKTNQLIRKIIYPELKIMYGTRKGCAV